MLDAQSLIDGYLDDVLTEEQHADLVGWLKADAQHARMFAEAALLHDRLRDAVLLGQADTQPPLSPRPRRLSWPLLSTNSALRTVASLAFILIGLSGLWFALGPEPVSAAASELNRIIDYSAQSKDRAYEIVVEETKPQGASPGSAREVASASPKEKRMLQSEAPRPPKPPLNGARLYLRNKHQFVLIRTTTEGLPFVTGCDGAQSWAINTKGPVRVSSDIHHFDHDVPGHETAVPLINLEEGLARLKQAYQLQFSALGPEEYPDGKDKNVRMLLAIKKPKQRGAQRIEITYDSSSGQILHMRFVQMPYGPERLDLRLSLVSEEALPNDFFEHTSHHADDRRVERD